MVKVIMHVTKGLAVAAALLAGNAHADYSQVSAVTRIDIVNSYGMLLLGSFGNPGNCGSQGSTADGLFVPDAHPNYNRIYAAAVTSMTTGLKLQGYAHGCTYVGWYGRYYSTITTSGAVYITP